MLADWIARLWRVTMHIESYACEMPLQLIELEWDDANRDHVLRHQVSIEEVEEVLYFEPHLRRTRQGRYLAYGQTLSGRHLVVVFVHRGRGRARPVTARPMDVRERRLLRRWRGR